VNRFASLKAAGQETADAGSAASSDAVFSGDTAHPVPCGSVVLTPTIRADSHADALAF
jgi:hypothetical protein